jgi:thiosulfate sulfurtransferase
MAILALRYISTIALLVYCYHGNMSQSAAAYFGEQGFEEAYSMDGGFSDWEVNFTDKIEAG